MQAVKFGDARMIYFSPVELPEALRREIVEGHGGEVQDDVKVIHPGGPRELYRPTYVLCASLADPTRYEFIDRGQVDPTRQKIVDTAFRVKDTVEGWWRFLELKDETRARMAGITGVEVEDLPGDPDRWL